MIACEGCAPTCMCMGMHALGRDAFKYMFSHTHTCVHLYIWARKTIHVCTCVCTCVFRRSIEGRGGARWRLVGYVSLRLGSLDTGPERKHWVQVMRDHSQRSPCKGVKGRTGQRRKLTSSLWWEVRPQVTPQGGEDPRGNGSLELFPIEASRPGIGTPASVSHWEGLPLRRAVSQHGWGGGHDSSQRGDVGRVPQYPLTPRPPPATHLPSCPRCGCRAPVLCQGPSAARTFWSCQCSRARA